MRTIFVLSFVVFNCLYSQDTLLQKFTFRDKGYFIGELGLRGIVGVDLKIFDNVTYKSYINGIFGISGSSDRLIFGMVPYFTNTIKYYYNIKRRVFLNKDISSFSGNYIGLSLYWYLKNPINVSNYGGLQVAEVSYNLLAIKWGHQRSFRKNPNWYYNFEIGLGYNWVPGLIYPDFSKESIEQLRPFGGTLSFTIGRVLYKMEPTFRLK